MAANVNDEDRVAEAGPHRFGGIRHSMLILLLTLCAGILRFTALDRPAIWGDEASTWKRICGNYPQLVAELRRAGFMPTHYLLEWWVKDGMPYWGSTTKPSVGEVSERAWWEGPPRRGGREERDAVSPPTSWIAWQPTHRIVAGGIAPTPFVLRFIPALCGTLLVPAIYFLASQLVARRTALLAALFTCCSAYALGYSRDAKMYSQFWLFVTLHVACLFWWLAAYRRTPVVPAARKRFSKQDELGEGVAGVLPAPHVGHIARAFIADAELGDPAATAARLAQLLPRLAVLVRWACWVTSGLAMIAFHAIGLAVVGIEVLILLATAPQRVRHGMRLLTAIASPVLYVVDRRRAAHDDLRSMGVPISSRRPDDAARRLSSSPRQKLRARWSNLALPPIVGFVIGAAAIVALWHSYSTFTRFYERTLPDPSTTSLQVDVNDAGIGWVEPYNRGRTALWLFGYNACAYLMNWEWPMPQHVWQVDPQAYRLLSWTATTLLIALAIGLLPWRQLVARFSRKRAIRDRLSRDRGPMPVTSFFLIAAWVLLPLYGLYVASGASQQFRKVRAVSPIEAVAAAVEPIAQQRVGVEKHSLQGALTTELRPAFAGERSWHDSIAAIRSLSWRDLLVLKTEDGATPRWWVLAAAGGAIAVLLVSRHGPIKQLPRVVTRAVTATVVLFGLLMVVYLIVPMQAASIWMPRYAGVVWPAFAIGVCVLLRRIPFLPLRWGVIVLLLAANLTNFVMRCRIGEPPTAFIAQDELANRNLAGMRLFGSMTPKQFGGPGTGSIFTLPNAYYLSIATGIQFTPNTALGAMSREFDFQHYDGDLFASGIAARMRSLPQVKEFTLWLERPAISTPGEAEARLQQLLGPSWMLAEPVQRWMIYDHWTWRHYYTLERHHWRRDEHPPLLPATTHSATSPARRPASMKTSVTTPTTREAAR